MQPRLLMVALAAALLAACGDSANQPAPDPQPADARIDQPPPPDAPGATDAAPDAMTPPTDDDHDGHVAAADCDDHDAAVWKTVSLYTDADHDGHGAGAATARCVGDTTPIGWAAIDGDCDDARADAWQTLTYAYRDADGDGATVAEVGSLCTGAALPAGYATAAVGDDCDDHDKTLAVWLDGYPDADHDHVGFGMAAHLCTSGALPADYAPVDGDCSPADPDHWQMLSYSYRDADHDGATVVEGGEVCSGAILPSGYSTAPSGNDCNDDDKTVMVGLAVFPDGDRDGHGIGGAVMKCTDGSVPDGYALSGNDCDDTNKTVWALLPYSYVDMDEDGVTIEAHGARCTAGTLDPPYFADAKGNDCDDTKKALTRWVVLYPDHDGDGVGAPPRAIECLGATIPDGMSTRGYDEDDNDKTVIETEDFDDLLDLVVLSS
jgi:hypothetical protein